MKKGYLFLIALALFFNLRYVLATNYEWTGSVSKSWSNSSNWQPNSVPTPGDSVSIASYDTILVSSDLYVGVFELKAGTIDLQSHTLNISGDASFGSGVILDGPVNINIKHTVTFGGTQFYGYVYSNSSDVLFNGSVFHDSVYVERSGEDDNYGTGTNTFFGKTRIVNSGTGNLWLADEHKNFYKGKLKIQQTNTGRVYLTPGTPYNYSKTKSPKGSSVMGVSICEDTTIFEDEVINIGYVSGPYNYEYAYCEWYMGSAAVFQGPFTTIVFASDTAHVEDGHIYLTFDCDVEFQDEVTLLVQANNSAHFDNAEINVTANATALFGGPVSIGVKADSGAYYENANINISTQGIATFGDEVFVLIQAGIDAHYDNAYIYESHSGGTTFGDDLNLEISGDSSSYVINSGVYFNGSESTTIYSDMHVKAPLVYVDGCEVDGDADIILTAAGAASPPASKTTSGGNKSSSSPQVSGAAYPGLLRIAESSSVQVQGELSITSDIANSNMGIGSEYNLCTLGQSFSIAATVEGENEINLQSITQTASCESSSFFIAGTTGSINVNACTFAGVFNAVVPSVSINNSDLGRYLNVVALTEMNLANSNIGYAFNTISSNVNIDGSEIDEDVNIYLVTPEGSEASKSTNPPLSKGNSNQVNGVAVGGSLNIAQSAPVLINGHLSVAADSGNTYVTIGSETEGCTIGSYCAVAVPVYGELNIQNTSQTDSAESVSFYIGGESGNLYIKSCSFKGSLTALAPLISIQDNAFHGGLVFLQSGSEDSHSPGGNVFKSNSIIANFGIANMFLSESSNDEFRGEVTFAHDGDANIYPAYGAVSSFNSNVRLHGDHPIEFGADGGTAVFNGEAAQQIAMNGEEDTPVAPNFHKMEINKSDSTLTLLVPVTVSENLTLEKGIIITDDTNIITLVDNATASGGSNSSCVSGPMIKIGDDEFEFPLGDSSLHAGAYHPLSISAPSDVDDVFMAQYFAQEPSYINDLDNTIGNLSPCEYWFISRESGSSEVYLKLGWNINSCNTSDLTNLRIARLNEDHWEDIGNGGTSGNQLIGDAMTPEVLSAFGYFTFAEIKCSSLSVYTSSEPESCVGNSDGQATVEMFGGSLPYAYSWSNSSTNAAITGLSGGAYLVTVTDAQGCTLEKTVEVTTLVPKINISPSSFMAECDGSYEIILTADDGISYSWSTSETTQSITVSDMGKYTVTVTDVIGCTAVSSIVLAK